MHYSLYQQLLYHTVKIVLRMMYTSVVVSPLSPQPHPWAGESQLTYYIQYVWCRLHCNMCQCNILCLWNTWGTASQDVVCMQLKFATENFLNYLRPNKVRVSTEDNGSFREHSESIVKFSPRHILNTSKRTELWSLIVYPGLVGSHRLWRPWK